MDELKELLELVMKMSRVDELNKRGQAIVEAHPEIFNELDAISEEIETLKAEVESKIMEKKAGFAKVRNINTTADFKDMRAVEVGVNLKNLKTFEDVQRATKEVLDEVCKHSGMDEDSAEYARLKNEVENDLKDALEKYKLKNRTMN